MEEGIDQISLPFGEMDFHKNILMLRQNVAGRERLGEEQGLFRGKAGFGDRALAVAILSPAKRKFATAIHRS